MAAKRESIRRRSKRMLLFFRDEYIRLHKRPAHTRFDRGGNLLGQLLKRYSVREIKNAVTYFLQKTDDAWIRADGGFTVGVFYRWMKRGEQ